MKNDEGNRKYGVEVKAAACKPDANGKQGSKRAATTN